MTSDELKNACTAPKKSGEVRVIILAGDYWHNSMMYETHWRSVLAPTGWNLLFPQSARFVTPEALALVDLFITARYAGEDSLGWTSDGVVDTRPTPSVWMTPEHEQALVENVTNRGMGLILIHAAIWSSAHQQFMALAGIKKAKMHGHLMMTGFYDMNADHPITQGVMPYEAVDEIFGVDLDETCEPLFRAKQTPELMSKLQAYTLNVQYDGNAAFPLDRTAGWTRAAGAGRVVGLNYLCHQMSFWNKSAKEIMWRSAHWAMQKEFPESGLIDGPYGMDR